MDDYVKYIIMYDNPWRDGEVTVKEFFNTEEEAHEYVRENPGQKWPVFVEDHCTEMIDVPNYVVEAITSYRRLDKRS